MKNEIAALLSIVCVTNTLPYEVNAFVPNEISWKWSHGASPLISTTTSVNSKFLNGIRTTHPEHSSFNHRYPPNSNSMLFSESKLPGDEAAYFSLEEQVRNICEFCRIYHINGYASSYKIH